MAIKKFILQGLTTSTHAIALRELFDIPEIERVILSVAFVSESGVQQIKNELKDVAHCFGSYCTFYGKKH